MGPGAFDFEDSNYFAPHGAVVGPVCTNEKLMFRPAKDERGRYRHHSYWQTDFCVRAWFDIRADSRTTRVDYVLDLPPELKRELDARMAGLTWYSGHQRRREVAEYIDSALACTVPQDMLSHAGATIAARRQNFLLARDRALKSVNMVILDYHDISGGGFAA